MYWTKCTPLLIDDGGDQETLASLGLKIVSEFKYLGINVSLQPQTFDKLNLLQLLAKFQTKLDVVAKFPLSLFERINLLKMLWMPQLLYVLHSFLNLDSLSIHFNFYKINQSFQRLF